MEPIVLMTERLELSVPVERDVDDIVAYANDPDVIAYTPVPVPYGRREGLEWIVQSWDGWRRGARLTFAVRRRDDERLLGTAVLFGFGAGAAEIGYAMHPDGRGHGFMTEAASRMLDWGFAPEPDGLGLERIRWNAIATNAASAAVARRLGMTFEGRRRSSSLHRGVRQDELTAAILRTDPRGEPHGWDGVDYGCASSPSSS
jgi:RimJ/RimL family protein N-acetyltransferase